MMPSLKSLARSLNRRVLQVNRVIFSEKIALSEILWEWANVKMQIIILKLRTPMGKVCIQVTSIHLFTVVLAYSFCKEFSSFVISLAKEVVW